MHATCQFGYRATAGLLSAHVGRNWVSSRVSRCRPACLALYTGAAAAAAWLPLSLRVFVLFNSPSRSVSRSLSLPLPLLIASHVQAAIDCRGQRECMMAERGRGTTPGDTSGRHVSVACRLHLDSCAETRSDAVRQARPVLSPVRLRAIAFLPASLVRLLCVTQLHLICRLTDAIRRRLAVDSLCSPPVHPVSQGESKASGSV